MQPIQMHLSKKKDLGEVIFSAFLKSRIIFEHFK